MSTILKALRRLEREQAAGSGRPLRERVATGDAEPEEPGPAPRARLPRVALAAGVVVLIAGAWYLGRSSTERADAELASAQPPVARRSDPLPPRVMIWRPVAERPQAVPPSREPEAETAFADEIDFAVIERADVTQLEESVDAATTLVQAEAATGEPRPAVPPTEDVAPPPPSAETATATPRSGPAVAPSPGADPPRILPAAPPEATLLRTSWHPDPARREAELQLVGSEEPIRLREGDAVGALIVITIEPSSVVFGHDGVELRRAVGEAL